MAQTVGSDGGAGNAGPPDQGGDGILNRPHRHGRALPRPEHRGLGRRRRLLFKQLAQGAACRGVQRHLSFLESLAVPYPNCAGAFAKHDVAPTQRRHLTDPQAGLQHELDQGVVAPGEPV
jgi:hypothetical protein